MPTAAAGYSLYMMTVIPESGMAVFIVPGKIGSSDAIGYCCRCAREGWFIDSSEGRHGFALGRKESASLKRNWEVSRTPE
jgi:hypothetical protein